VVPNDFATGPIATQQLGDVATQPVDGNGDAINLNQTAAEAADSGNCTIAVPANPLTAQGLASPYKLGDGCSMANPDQEAFVEATILSPSGQVQVYNPDGKLIGRIDVPERPIDLVFGGPDHRTLFILTHASLYAVRTKSAGL